MNLIEKYGSYEAVKSAAVNYRNSGDDLTAKKFERVCLEYRRQHNIFEVGDLVVDTNYKDSDVQEIKSISGNRINVFHKNKVYYFATFVFSFRHATDEEIKAGHRL